MSAKLVLYCYWRGHFGESHFRHPHGPSFFHQVQEACPGVDVYHHFGEIGEAIPDGRVTIFFVQNDQGQGQTIAEALGAEPVDSPAHLQGLIPSISEFAKTLAFCPRCQATARRKGDKYACPVCDKKRIEDPTQLGLPLAPDELGGS